MALEGHSSAIELLKGPGIRFAIVGVSLTMVDLLLYQLLANILQVSFFEVPPSICAVWVGTPIVILINFFVSRRFVWNTSTLKRQTIVPFFALNLSTGIIVQSGVISFTLWLFGVAEWTIINSGLTNLFAKCVAVGIGMVLNFLGAKYLFDR